MRQLQSLHMDFAKVLIIYSETTRFCLRRVYGTRLEEQTKLNQMY